VRTSSSSSTPRRGAEAFYDTIRLGRHQFAVNRQAPELTLVPYEDTLAFALIGTDYRSPVTDPEFAATRPSWDRALPSESPEVYRAEHLAARLLAEHGADGLAGADLAELARRAAEAAYDEGYERGVHDHDAALILEAVLGLSEDAGLLSYPGTARGRPDLLGPFHDRRGPHPVEPPRGRTGPGP